MNSETKSKLPNYGGQAVIEGVMMRGKKAAAIAMRNPEGEITIHTEQLSNIYQSRIMKIPFLRGLIGLNDALILGMRALTISANTQTGEDEQLEGMGLYLTFAFSLAIAVLIFLMAYMWGVGQIEDIKRVFSYHGAEHKVINAFEDNAVLDPEIVKKYSLEHPRCGTAFLLIVVLISVLLFTILGPMTLLWRLVSRVLLLPVLAGIAYEYLQWTAKNIHHPLVKVLVKPNLALQRLTTNEPSLDIIEVSIAAFNAMRELEEA